MLIITADDYGRSKNATDNILTCFSHKRITTTSAMVFMVDSDRAAEICMGANLEVGLHLNFTQPFNAANINSRLYHHQERLVSYLTKHRIFHVIYNPSLADSFSYSFLAQQDEFQRLYGKLPDSYIGHQHVHLCANVVLSGLIPRGARVRRTFSFKFGEKNLVNFLYRKFLDAYVSRRFISTDCFFNINPLNDQERLRLIINRAQKENVEVLAHPEIIEEFEFLLSVDYWCLISSVPCGNFNQLHKRACPE